VYEARRERIAAEHGGIVPAYASATIGGQPVDVEPEERASRPRRRLTEPDEPTEISDEEFEALRRDLDIDDETVAPPPRRTRAAVVRPPAATPAPPRPADRGADGREQGNGRAPDEPENDGVLKEPRRPRGRRNRKHGRSR
jgi:SecD/SecF fusion protein